MILVILVLVLCFIFVLVVGLIMLLFDINFGIGFFRLEMGGDVVVY